jgi:hypothetical protein
MKWQWILSVALLQACGYHVGGRADLVPKSIQTIYIPAFRSQSTHYRLADLLPNEIGREFTARTRFQIVSAPDEADAILNGTINDVGMFPAVSDPLTGKTTSIRITVVLALNLLERKTGRVLYSRPGLTVGQNFESPEDPHQQIDESGPAFHRLSRDLARDVVSSVVENF